MELTDTNLFARLYEVWLTESLVTRLTLARQGDLKNSFIEFPENWSHVLVSNTVSHTDGTQLGEGSLWIDLKMCVRVAVWNKLGAGLVVVFLHDTKLAESALKP